MVPGLEPLRGGTYMRTNELAHAAKFLLEGFVPGAAISGFCKGLEQALLTVTMTHCTTPIQHSPDQLCPSAAHEGP